MKFNFRYLILGAGLLAAACDNTPDEPGNTDETQTDSGTRSDGGVMVGGGGSLPCDIQTLVDSQCAVCHGAGQMDRPVLAQRSDFTALSFGGQSFGARSLERMKSPENPMPPKPSPGVSSQELAAFEAWVAAGMPEGTGCSTGSTPDAGMDIPDAGSQQDAGMEVSDAGMQEPDAGMQEMDAGSPVVCTSGTYYMGNRGSAKMNPGMACVGCHKMQAPRRAFAFMGTVYSTPREDNRCNSVTPPAGTRVEILDMNGDVKYTLTPNEVGNFFSNSTAAGFTLPYRARVIANGQTREMKTPQMSGDCNSCHTATGGPNGFPFGRITWPSGI